MTELEMVDEALGKVWAIATRLSEKLRGDSRFNAYIQKSEAVDPLALGAFCWAMFTLPEEIWEVMRNGNK